MALRVLLADESTTIKKVMQLALQDFAVEVKAVHVGVDVVEVARSFQPDIIFVDVLLQKRNGYEVSADLKNDSDLGETPVVLMWSSFMDLDEPQAAQSGADRRLEKPFDVENLRQIVLELVPKTRSQRLAHFLKFPESFSEPLKDEEKKKASARPVEPVPKQAPKPASTAKAQTQAQNQAQAQAKSPAQAPAKSQAPRPPEPVPMPPPVPPREEPKPFTGLKNVKRPEPPKQEVPNESAWNMESFEDIGEFAAEVEKQTDASGDDETFEEFRITPPARTTARTQTGFTKTPPPREPDLDEDDAPAGDDRDPWSHQDLSRFKLNLPPVSVDNEDIELDVDDIPEREPTNPDFLMRRGGGGSEKTRSMQRPPLALEDYSAPEPTPVPEPEPDQEIEIPSSSHLMLEDEDGANQSHLEMEFDPNAVTQPAFGFDAELDSETETEKLDSVRAPSQKRVHDEDLNEDLGRSLTHGQIPRLSPERLEEIIRAQSREIIESVVRRVVPDLATDIIREELQRLLEDTGSSPGRRDKQR